jgi:hypothetical protein
MPPDDQRDYEVCYGKPPPHTRFVKGQSGNPRGRPPGAKNLRTLLTKALNELVVVTDNGGRRKVSKREAIVTQLVNRSAKAGFKAIPPAATRPNRTPARLYGMVRRTEQTQMNHRCGASYPESIISIGCGEICRPSKPRASGSEMLSCPINST